MRKRLANKLKNHINKQMWELELQFLGLNNGPIEEDSLRWALLEVRHRLMLILSEVAMALYPADPEASLRWLLNPLPMGPPGTVWIVGKALAECEDAWEFAGVYSDYEGALLACRTEDYFMGPAMMDAEIPDETVPWSGAFYPLEQKGEEPLD